MSLRSPTLLASLLIAMLAPGCVGGARSGRRIGADRAEPTPRDTSAPTGDGRVVADNREIGHVTPAEFEEFKRAWVLFVRDDPGWPRARKDWIARGGAAPYVLSENLLRYFWSATKFGGRPAIDRIAESAKAVGEPAVGYFASVLVLDTWPLKEPILVPAAGGGKREIRVWQNDDVTRQHLAIILSAIGPAAVPRLASRACLEAESVSARRYVLYALGRIATDPAIDAISTMLSRPDWQDRGSAAKALGFALPSNPRAREPLQRASNDPDPFVRKKATEALAGKTKSEF